MPIIYEPDDIEGPTMIAKPRPDTSKVSRFRIEWVKLTEQVSAWSDVWITRGHGFTLAAVWYGFFALIALAANILASRDYGWKAIVSYVLTVGFIITLIFLLRGSELRALRLQERILGRPKTDAEIIAAEKYAWDGELDSCLHWEATYYPDDPSDEPGMLESSAYVECCYCGLMWAEVSDIPTVSEVGYTVVHCTPEGGGNGPTNWPAFYEPRTQVDPATGDTVRVAAVVEPEQPTSDAKQLATRLYEARQLFTQWDADTDQSPATTRAYLELLKEVLGA